MQELFLFLYRFRAFLLFIVLEVGCGWIIVQNNSYLGASFFNSSNAAAGYVLEKSNSISEYFNLKAVNKKLSKENATLLRRITTEEQILAEAAKGKVITSSFYNQYHFISAKVINNSIRNSSNYITINRGAVHGIKPNMGVVNTEGIIGKVKSVSKHYSTIISLLHTDFLVSSKIKRTGTICSINWDGKQIQKAKVLYVPRHISISKNDTITSSGFDGIFPGNIPIGVVSDYSISDDATFYDIDITLLVDFASLSFVYTVENQLLNEKDSLELISK